MSEYRQLPEETHNEGMSYRDSGAHNMMKASMKADRIAAKDRERMEKIRQREEAKKKLKEDAPTNAVGGGAIAGVGIGPDGEPGFTPKAMTRYKDKNKRSAGLGFKDFVRKAKAIGMKESTDTHPHKVFVRDYSADIDGNSKEWEKTHEPLKKHEGEFDYHADKGIGFKFKTAHQARAFHDHIMRNHRELSSSMD